MEQGSKQDGAVNMTRAMEALSPWLNHPRKTIIKVEGLVIAAAALLLLQLILGSCRRRWHNSFIKYGLQVCNGIMFPLIVYTLGTMQSAPIKNSSYPVWAGFLIMASAGTTAIRQHDFYDSFYKKCTQVSGELFRDLFYVMMFVLLMDPNTYNWNAAWDLMLHGKSSRASSHCVFALVNVVLWTKIIEPISLLCLGYKHKWGLLVAHNKSGRTQAAQTTANDGASVSNPQSMKGNKYVVSYRRCAGGLVTVDQIWDCCGNAADAYALKDLCVDLAARGTVLFGDTRSQKQTSPEANITELAEEVMEESKELFKSCDGLPEIYSKIKSLNGTPEEEDDPKKMFQQGVKLGKQLEQMEDGYGRWEVLKDFWAKKIIHVADSHYTSKQHMQHLENGGEFLTHIWALLSHAGILNLKKGKDQEVQANNPGSGTSAATG